MTEKKGYRIEDCNMKLLIKKDRHAFQVFYRKHIGLYIQFCARFIDDPEAVRDIVQEAFIAMWEWEGTFQEESHIKAFLYTTVRHKAINYLRDQQVKRKNSEKILQLRSDIDFRNIVIEEEMYDFLCRQIEMLSPMQREILWMHIDGLSDDEIATKLSISIHTVRTHKQRAKNLLKKYLTRFLLFFVLTSSMRHPIISPSDGSNRGCISRYLSVRNKVLE